MSVYLHLTKSILGFSYFVFPMNSVVILTFLSALSYCVASSLSNFLNSLFYCSKFLCIQLNLKTLRLQVLLDGYHILEIRESIVEETWFPNLKMEIFK